MVRTPNTLHTAKSLIAKMDEIIKAAKALKKSTRDLGDRAVLLAHQAKIDEGIAAIGSMRLELLTKLHEKNFVEIKVSEEAKQQVAAHKEKKAAKK